MSELAVLLNVVELALGAVRGGIVSGLRVRCRLRPQRNRKNQNENARE